MPVSVVVGGQFGSEGKGKVAYEFAKLHRATAVVRVGGPNSGHTVVDNTGQKHAFQHLPTAAILPDVLCVIGAGSYVDVDILLREKSIAGLADDRLIIDPRAVIITDAHRRGEIDAGLRSRIGSTGSGTGAAVLDRISRSADVQLARACVELRRFVCETSVLVRDQLDANRWVVVEGTQGFGLSLLHSEYYPFVTSRDTTAAGFVSEAGLSPLDVSEVVLTLRAHPIRVAGNSGPLPNEIDWATVTSESGSAEPIQEHTTVTKKIRRVGRFDSRVAKAAISHNRPTHIVLNHLDYVDATCCDRQRLTSRALSFLRNVEASIQRRIDYVGLGPRSMIPISDLMATSLAG